MDMDSEDAEAEADGHAASAVVFWASDKSVSSEPMTTAAASVLLLPMLALLQ